MIAVEIRLNFGEIFSGVNLQANSQQNLVIRELNNSSLLNGEIGNCTVGGQNIDHLDITLNGRSIVSIHDLGISGITIGIKGVIPADLSGPLVCHGGVIRVQPSGIPITRLEVFSSVHRRPEWQNAAELPIADTWFSFDNLVAQSRPNLAVESRPIEVRLAHALSYPAPVLYAAPRGCHIGITDVDPSNTVLVRNSDEIHDSEILNIPCACKQELKLRILPQAGAAASHGLVLCSTPGQLIYTY